MDSPLPEWLDHYLSVPAWVIVREIPGHLIVWVNERVAEENGRKRDWFVGKSIYEVWPDTETWLQYDIQAVEEGRAVDTVMDGHNLRGEFYWLDVHRTPIDRKRLLVVSRDVTAAIRLAALRLVLGRGIAGADKPIINESFARQLLEGASLETLCETQRIGRAEALANLSQLVAERRDIDASSPPVTMPEDEPVQKENVPDWIAHYWELPVPTGLFEYPSMRIRWVNRLILENNRVEMDDVVGHQAEDVWRESAAWKATIERSMHERRPLDSIQVGHNRRGEQHWVILHCTPVNADTVLLMGEDVTAKIRVRALRMLLGVRDDAGEQSGGAVSDAFARLMLDGASIANLCAALELSEAEVLGRLGQILN